MRKYNREFYKERVDSLISAKEIVPLIINAFNPKSVVDVGCGTGEFLSVFMEYGVVDVLGIDGYWVPIDQLRIPKENFLILNLEHPKPINKKFDLVISLEVAEHLSPASTDDFIDFLTSLGDVIVFSAAIPGQGGTNHVNERWHDDWKKFFEKRNFHLIDYFRDKLWYNSNVSFWYAQNTFLYVHSNQLQNILEKTSKGNLPHFPLNVVHYKLFEKKIRELNKIYRFIPKFLLNVIYWTKKFFKLNK